MEWELHPVNLVIFHSSINYSSDKNNQSDVNNKCSVIMTWLIMENDCNKYSAAGPRQNDYFLITLLYIS